jgi:GNAT superfamily N-acetyltransferase
MSSVVRRASGADAELISALNVDVQGLHAAALPSRFKPSGPDSLPAAEALALIADPDHLVFIAEVDGAPAGYAYAELIFRHETSLHYASRTVYLHHLSVRPQYRRHGVGTNLIDAVRTAGRELGFTLLAADVWTFNHEARAFFIRRGFEVYNERLWSR